MHKAFQKRLASLPTLLVVLFITLCATLTIFTDPAAAAPRAQTTLPDFTLNAETVVTVTVAVTGGQVIVVPLDLTFVAENLDGQTDLSIIAAVEQQAGMFIGVSPENAIAATLELPQAENASPDAPSASVISGEGTHVANANSNQRAGPGTNFPIVGRVPSGDAVTVVGENQNGTWLQLDNGNWVAEFLLDPIPDSGNNNDDADSDDTNGNDDGNDDGNNSGNNNNDDEANEQDNEQDDTQTNTLPTGQDVETTPVSAPIDIEPEELEPEEVEPVLPDQVALANYLLDLAAIGTGARDAVSALNDLVDSPQQSDPVWRNDVAARLAVLSATLDQYLALSPIPGYEDLHTQVTEVALTCEQAVDYLVVGLSSTSAIDPALATQSVQACATQSADLTAVALTFE